MSRKIALSFLMLFLISVVACKKKAPANALKGFWCKRYTGNIAGQPVVVNIFCDGDNTARGTYYYANKSEILYLSLSNDSANAGHVIVEESVITDREAESESETDDEDSEITNFWDVVFDGDSLTGKFHKDNGAPTYNISLHEDYTNGYALGYARYDDSVKVKGTKFNYTATASCIGIMPAQNVNSADAAFITSGIQKLLSFGDSARLAIQTKNNADNYQKAYVKEYLDNFKKEANDWLKDTVEPEPMGNYEQYADIIPIYNDKQFLVIGNQYYDYSGGAHGNHGSIYVNMDVKNKKVLQLGDVMQLDSVAISSQLNAQARVKLKIAADKPITDQLFVSSVPPSDNFIIADRGITFCYNPYEIACYAAGEIKIFVPYKNLKPLLKPEFITRMGLKL